MSLCDTCRCPLKGDSARLLVAENNKGTWGAMLCRQCGHLPSMFDTEGLEYAPADDPRWVPLLSSPAQDLKMGKDVAGAMAWIRQAIVNGRRWTQKIRKEASDDSGRTGLEPGPQG